MRARLLVTIAVGLSLATAAVRAQYYQTDFPEEEFRSRHAVVHAAGERMQDQRGGVCEVHRREF
jgi:hypothetical protein